MVHVEASKIIEARSSEIYDVVSDYQVGHPAILPKQFFTSLKVIKGGKGAGTELVVEMNVYGNKSTFHQIVTEPEPGRLIMERDLNRNLATTFRFEPLNDGAQTRVTITTDFEPKPGFAGWIEKTFNPPVVRSIYEKELNQLADYMAQKK